MNKRYQALDASLAARFGATLQKVDSICDELVRRREQYGISYVTVMDIAMQDFAPVVARLAGH